MSKYPIPKPSGVWSYNAFAVFAGLAKAISGCNPGLYENGIVSGSSGLGLIAYKPASDIINFISNTYPELTYNDGLAQIEFLKTGAAWIYDAQVDTHRTFTDFLQNCGSNLQAEAEHLLFQIGYAATRTDAANYVNNHIYSVNTTYLNYQNEDPLKLFQKKWKSGNYTLSADETKNNMDIIFAYARGYVYKNLTWLLFKHYGWR